MQKHGQRLLAFAILGISLQSVAAAMGWKVEAAAHACPFCSAVSQTFSEEINTMDVAVIARLVKVPPASEKPGEEIAKATFEIAQVVKGEGLVKTGETIETLYFGDGAPGKSFLVMGIDPPKVMWSTPLPLSDRAQTYLTSILKLPKDGAERLAFFYKHLEDEDELLARDSYDEFAKAPYAQVKELKDRMNHDQILAWIKNPEIPASRRRLYFVMLGICGDEKKDAPLLEEFMRSSDRKAKSGLDSLIACYLTLRGEKGLPLVNELFLANPKADYADTYSAIMAIRFHGTEGNVIDKKALVASLHHMLERPELADLVIPDLARWEDWGAIDKLMELFKTADDKSSWVRVPVVNYLRACPLPRAKELLKECEKIDPAAVKRANSFFPQTPAPAPAPAAEKASKIEFPGKSRPAVAGYQSPIRGQFGDEVAAASLPVAPQVAQPEVPADQAALFVNQGAAPAAALKHHGGSPPNLWLLLGVPWGVGLVLLAAQWSLLRGWR
jgi:hypothetical protein